MERAVGRDELQSPRSSPEPELDPEVLERLKRQADFTYETRDTTEAGYGPPQDDDEQLDFQLFATSKPGVTASTSKIRLRSPTPQTGEAGFVDSGRPSKYYFADATDKSSYISTALSGADILKLAKQPWPGSAYPWKVLQLPPSGETGSELHSLRLKSLSVTQFSTYNIMAPSAAIDTRAVMRRSADDR